MKQFKTESQKLLDLMINSIYTNKEIFLRELISNASDAVDKLYFKSLTDDAAKIEDADKGIRIAYDKDARVLTVSDNGIGMTKDELDLNLGTIAHSDSQDFKKVNAEKQGTDIDIIGQFGVGFYSAFMVAGNVRVVSRAYGSDEAYEWESDGIRGYTIKPAERAMHGTDVILMLKPNAGDENYDNYLSEWGLKNLIKKYSNYVRYPIRMEVTKEREMPKPEDAGEDYKPQYEEYKEIETINSMIPIWKRNKSELQDEDYNEFFKSNFHEYADPLRHMSVHAEGTLNYDALLYIPSKAPFDLYTKDFEKGLALYSSNVLIMDKCDELLPDCFNFVRGVVDSQDLTLNISRETLQHNGQLHAIARKIEKKIKSELADMRDNAREDYETFFENFGRSLKFGLYYTYGQNAELVSDLLLFYSAKEKKNITLDEYIAAMPADQKDIYYAAGDNAERLAKLPVVTSIMGRGFDVLLCSEDVDEFCMQMLHEYKEKHLKNVSAGDLDLETEDEKKSAEELADANKDLFEAMQSALGEEVVKVAISTRLTDAPACITTEGPITLEMERVMNARGADKEGVKSKRILELNPKHAVFEVLQAAQSAGDADKVKLYAELLYGQALLVEGVPLPDPVAYSEAVCTLMK